MKYVSNKGATINKKVPNINLYLTLQEKEKILNSKSNRFKICKTGELCELVQSTGGFYEFKELLTLKNKIPQEHTIEFVKKDIK